MDLYVILGLDRGAKPGEVRRAYRRLARKYHPDLNPGDRAAAAVFEQVAQAYDTLSDPERRRDYDRRGSTTTEATASSAAFVGFDFSSADERQPGATFGDLFADVVRRAARGAGASRAQDGADLHARLRVGFEDAMRGTVGQVPLTRIHACRPCGGQGVVEVTDARCPACRGAGAVRAARQHMIFTCACDACSGSGQLRQRACPHCGGDGGTTRSESVAVEIPAGVADGSRVRVPGAGHAGRFGGPSGDLYVTVSVEPHRVFRREGDDLRVIVPVAVHEAALGARIAVPTLEGPAMVRVLPGAQSGQRLRLRGRGAPGRRPGTRGDQIVELRLVLPAVLDERSKELLREFGHINSEDVRATLRD